MAGLLTTIRSLELPEGTYSGRHEPVGDIASADCLILQEFTPGPQLRPNQQSLDYICTNETITSLPAFVSNSLAVVSRERGLQVVGAFQGVSAKGRQENLGTYGELSELVISMENYGYRHPLFVTSGYNVGNVIRQAGMLGITDVIVPPDLPRSFALGAARYGQLWTTCWSLWAGTARLRLALLMRNGH